MAAHGTASGYRNDRCRCGPCHAAWLHYMREWRARQKGVVRASKKTTRQQAIDDYQCLTKEQWADIWAG